MRILVLILLSLFFSGCGEPKPCVPSKVYVKAKVPRLRTLYEIKPYQIRDFSVIDNNYYRVNRKELHLASKASQKRINNIKFYEKQNNKFNQEFVDAK